MPDSSVAVIGAGVVGLAAAAELSREFSDVVLLERRSHYGRETSSRNSEVIHAGIYDAPGSLKARLCVEGNRLLYEFCREHGVPHRNIGKIITAVEPGEEELLESLYARGRENGAPLERLTGAQVKKLEPNAAAIMGLESPSTGILSAHRFMDALFALGRERGVLFQPDCEAVGIEKIPAGYRLTVRESGRASSFTSERIVNAAGLGGEAVARLAGINTTAAGYSIHFCKGSYFSAAGALRGAVSRLIYPAPGRHSLGIHVVIGLDGEIRLGPDVEYLGENPIDYSVDAAKRPVFAAAARKLIPALKDEDLSPAFCGIRARLQGPDDAPRDFVIREESSRGLPGFVNLIGIDSPGLTAALAIAREVAAGMRD